MPSRPFHFDELLAAVLRDIFGDVDGARLAELTAKLALVECAAGQVLVREGEPSDALYIVLSGRLRALSAASGESVVLGEISRGEVIGEMGIITGRPRGATVQAVRDSFLMRLAAADFEAILQTWPNVALPLTRKILQRQARINRRHAAPQVVNVCVLPITPLPLAARDLAARLAGHLRAALALDGEGAVALHAPDLLPDELRGADWEAQPAAKRRLAMWLDQQEQQHRMQVFACDGGDSAWTRLALRHADRILLVADADAAPELSPLEARHLAARPISNATQSLLLLHPDGRAMPRGTRRWLRARSQLRADGTSHYHLRPGRAGDFGRLARILSGTAIGLVLAGGGARGFSQLGVMQALEENGLTWDMAGGTSIGAVMASYAAMDLPVDVAIAHARRAFERNPTRDYTLLPLVAMLRGRRLRKVIDDAVAAAAGPRLDAEDLWKPFFCVASNYSQARTEVLRHGGLARMLTASVSIPAALPPVVWKGDLLSDGGTFNNYPVDVMRESGAARILGVDLRSERYRPLPFRNLPGPFALLVDRYLRPAHRRRYRDIHWLPTMVVNVATLPSVAHDRLMRELTDLQFAPNVSRVGMLDWKAFDHVVRIGLRHGRLTLAEESRQPLVHALRQLIWSTAEAHPAPLPQPAGAPIAA